MVDSDNMTVGQHAEAWCKVIGLHGDPFRMIVVNKLVARVLNHFGSEEAKKKPIAKPHALILKSIAALPVDADQQIEAQVQELSEAHSDTVRLANEFSSLAGTSLLDFGSGNGYLGGWLSTLGVRYTGVEPSIDLHKAAQTDLRLAGANLIQAKIREFCEGQSKASEEAPTLISIIGVVDLLADPEGSLNALFDFLAQRMWLNVPVLVATFDPDFFLPGLPVSSYELQTSAHYGVAETFGIRDPADWEVIFSNCGFHILEQRPLHISGLPSPLSKYLHELHKRLFADNESAPDNSETEGNGFTKARVPPRQGPFYFWLLCPRNTVIDRREHTPNGVGFSQPFRMERFPQEETLSVVGNLGTRVYRVIEGSAYFDSPGTGRMDFNQGALFGQLEASCNYASSRIFGTLVASGGSKMETVDSQKILAILAASANYTEMLFLSLLHHLSSVQFTHFTSSKRNEASNTSAVLTGRPHTSQFVRNVAACLLQAIARVMPDTFSGGYRSRILVELNKEEISKFIYGPTATREADKLTEIFCDLVQANVIDSFSAYSLENSDAQNSFDDVENEGTTDVLSPLHIGWHTARFVLHSFHLRDTDIWIEDIRKLALAISAFLGSTKDSSDFIEEFRQMNRSETRDRNIGGGRDKPKAIIKMPKTTSDRRDHIVELLQCSEDEKGRLQRFLDMLRTGFNYKEKGDFSRTHGLSSFIVVRDIWALLACLLDKKDMWNTSKKNVSVNEYIRQEAQKPRIVAYIQECIAYAGRQSGLENCPW